MSIRVLVVDDSAVMRGILSQVLPADGDIEVVALAEDAAQARALIKQHDPAVLTLDVEMPSMNGIEFLDRLMRLRPMPVVMVSSLTRSGAGATLLALELGAVDFVQKPGDGQPIEAWGAALREKIRLAGGSRIRERRADQGTRARLSAPPGGDALIALAASTGGVDAIRTVLSLLPLDCPPVVIAQHMPAGFTSRFAARLDEITGLRVVEAEDGMPLAVGTAHVAPGGRQLAVARHAGRPVCAVFDGDGTSGLRPSADILFHSVAATCGSSSVGAVLTGMGRDGASGLAALRAAGGFTIGESEATALVYGMPRVAFEEGAVIQQVPLGSIAARLCAGLARIGRAGAET